MTDEKQTNQNNYIHFFIGLPAKVIIDGVENPEPTTITRALLFDVVQQRAEYGREIIILPILRPLSDITVDELKECNHLSGVAKNGKKIFSYDGSSIPEFVKYWKAFEPDVLFYLMKQFDMLNLIPQGVAIDKTKLNG